MQRFFSFSTGILLSLLLVACGGGGGSDNNLTSSPTPNNNSSEPPPAPTWTFNVYPPSDQFINFCADPRSGGDPYNNYQPYPDKAGTAMHEKMWLRSFTNETYLWYDEVEDNDPKQFDSVTAYFEQLKTNEQTPNGADKDQFHFYESYESFQKQAQSGVSTGYGIGWAVISTTPPRNFTVAFVEPNSPAANAGIVRGDRITAIDGVDFIASPDTDTLNAGLSPSESEPHVFVFESVAGEQKEVTLTSMDIETTPVRRAQVLESNNRKVGYVQYNQFIPTAQQELIDAFSLFRQQQIDDLVLDMRYNGGGRVIMAAQLGFMVAGNQSLERVFTTNTLNDKCQAEERSTEFESRVIDWPNNAFTEQQLPSVSLPRVYILTTRGTASASENVINGLRGIDVEVVLIGDATRGKPYGFVPAQNCGTVYYTIQFASENAKGFGDYADGFMPSGASSSGEIGLTANVPGCQVSDDFSQPLGSQQEALFAAALQHIETGTCPAQAQFAPAANTQGLNQQGGAVTVPQHPARDGAIWIFPEERNQ